MWAAFLSIKLPWFKTQFSVGYVLAPQDVQLRQLPAPQRRGSSLHALQARRHLTPISEITLKIHVQFQNVHSISGLSICQK